MPNQTPPIPDTSLLSAPPPRKNLIAPTTQNCPATQNCPDTQNPNFAQASAKTYPSQPLSNSRFTNNTDPNTLLNKFRDIIDNPSVKITLRMKAYKFELKQDKIIDENFTFCTIR